jgi:hypothetical protein
MKFTGFVLLMILFMSVTLMQGQNVSIEDFRIPHSHYQRFLGSMSGDWNKSDDNFYEPFSFSESSESRQLSNLQTSLDYTFADFNEDRSLEISIGLDGTRQFGKTNSTWITPSSPYGLSQISTFYSLEFVPSVRYSDYITPDLWHWFVEGSGRFLVHEQRDISEQISNNVVTHDSVYSKNNSWSVLVGGGIGYGKMRDGAPVFSVLRILDKLSEDSLLIRPLEKDEILRLVNILARRNEYSYTQDRYVKFLMEDLFTELQKMGVLKNNTLTAYSVLRAVEAISEWIEPRPFGWRARLGIQRSFYEELQVGPYASSYDSYKWSSHDMLQLACDYGYPVSLNLHVTSNFSMGIPGVDSKRKINISFNAEGIYQVGERIDASLSGSFNRNQQAYGYSNNQDIFTRSIRYSIGMSFRFFIENNIYFSVGSGYDILQSYDYAPSATRSSYNEGPSIRFGVNYRFI